MVTRSQYGVKSSSQPQPRKRASYIKRLKRGLVLSLICASLAAHASAQDMTQIKHIVFIIKENRTFDNYFGTFPGAMGATSGPISNGQTIALNHTPDRVRDLGHGWKDASTAINGGKMNQFD